MGREMMSPEDILWWAEIVRNEVCGFARGIEVDEFQLSIADDAHLWLRSMHELPEHYQAS